MYEYKHGKNKEMCMEYRKSEKMEGILENGVWMKKSRKVMIIL